MAAQAEPSGFRRMLPTLAVLTSSVLVSFGAFVAFLYATLELGPKDAAKPAKWDTLWFLPAGLLAVGVVLAVLTLRRSPNALAIGCAVVGVGLIAFLLSIAPFL